MHKKNNFDTKGHNFFQAILQWPGFGFGFFFAAWFSVLPLHPNMENMIKKQAIIRNPLKMK